MWMEFTQISLVFVTLLKIGRNTIYDSITNLVLAWAHNFARYRCRYRNGERLEENRLQWYW